MEKNKQDTLAMEMLKELKANAKRWFIISMVELFIILCGAYFFVWYLNTPTEQEDEVIYTQDADTQGNNSGINQKIGE